MDIKGQLSGATGRSALGLGADRFEQALNSGDKRVVIVNCQSTRVAGSGGVTMTQTDAQNMNIALSGSASYNNRFNTFQTSGSVEGNYIDLVFSSPDISKITAITLRFYPNFGSSNTTYYTRTYTITNEESDKKYLFRAHIDTFGTSGSPTWTYSADSQVNILVQTSAAGSIDVYGGIVVTDPPKFALIMSDDGNDDVYQAIYPEALKRNVPMTIYVNSTLIDGANRLTLAQCLEMQRKGMLIANHTDDGTNLTSDVAANGDYSAIKHVDDGMLWMRDNGLYGSNHLAAPQNAMDSTTWDLFVHSCASYRAGMTTAPQDIGTLYSDLLLTPKNYNGIAFRAVSIEQDTHGDAASVYTNWVEAAWDNGVLPSLNFHLMTGDGTGTLNYSQANFATLLDTILSNGGIPITVEDYLHYYKTIHERLTK